MNRLIQYIIEAKDATGRGIESAMNRVRKFGETVKSSLGMASKNLNTDQIAEKFIHTEHVLDTVGRALDRMGVSGEEFRDAMDTLEKRLNDFNKTGENSDALFQHFRASMEECGLTAKQIDDGIAMLKRNMVGVGESGADAAKTLKSDFRGVHTVMSALEGNVFAAGRAFTWLLGHIKKLNLSASALSGISIAVYAIVEVVSKAVQWWGDYKRKQEEIQQLRFEDTLKRYADAQREVSAELSKYEKQLDREIERKKKLIDQNSRLAQQELEMARLKAVEGTTGTERDDINRDFAAQKAQIKAEADLAKAQVDIEAQSNYEEFLKKLEAKLKPQQERMKAQLDAIDKQVKDEEERQRKKFSSVQILDHMEAGGYGGGLKAVYRFRNQSEVQDAMEEWMAEDEEYRKLREKRDKLKDGYDDIVADLEDFAEKRQKAADKASDAKIEADNIVTESNLDQWKDEEERMHDYYDLMAELEEDAAREAEKAAREEYKLKLQMEKELHDERLKDARDEMREAVSLQRDASQRLNSAQNKVNEAWGFYKDSDAMRSYIADSERELAAQKQYKKDFDSLQKGSWSDELATARRLNRRGETDKLEEMFAKWRKGSNALSVEQEATMRVAIAKDEEKQAQKALDEINERVADAAANLEICSEKVSQLCDLVTEGGE